MTAASPTLYLLDANTCIRYLNGRAPNIRTHLQAVHRNQVRVCSIVKGEMLAGSLRSTDPVRSQARQRAFFSRFVSLPFGDAEAEAYARIRAHLLTVGNPIGPNDMLIAAIAVANGLTLVTHNTNEFSRVPGLTIEDWEI
jgi:tRNA(fMet)-specific endonuclease VapC